MPEVTTDERGRRKFQLHKEKAVEAAVEKIRQNLGSEWTIFSQQDVMTLTYILGEAWVSVERSIWEQSSFTRLTKKDIARMKSILRERQLKNPEPTTEQPAQQKKA